VLDDNSRGKEDRLSDLLDDIDLRTGSIQDEDKVSRACIGVDQVIHLAYINGTKTFYERPSLVLDVAVRGFSVLADAMRDRGVNRLVLASSSEVYQSPSLFPTPEEVEMVVPSLENPRYSYGLGKIFQEFYSYHAMPFLDELLIFRPHNIYGPDMGNLHVVPQLIEKCTKAKKLGSTFYIQGDGSQTRSFCYIDDFILGFRLILQITRWFSILGMIAKFLYLRLHSILPLWLTIEAKLDFLQFLKGLLADDYPISRDCVLWATHQQSV
jgi:nucleoside-diphosphate-sugar epimerase